MNPVRFGQNMVITLPSRRFVGIPLPGSISSTAEKQLTEWGQKTHHHILDMGGAKRLVVNTSVFNLILNPQIMVETQKALDILFGTQRPKAPSQGAQEHLQWAKKLHPRIVSDQFVKKNRVPSKPLSEII